MRINRRFRRLDSGPRLTDQQELEMIVGPADKSAFESEDARRAVYFRHREEILKLVTPDCHTWAEVEYELGGFPPEEGGRVTMALNRIDATKAAPG